MKLHFFEPYGDHDWCGVSGCAEDEGHPIHFRPFKEQDSLLLRKYAEFATDEGARRLCDIAERIDAVRAVYPCAEERTSEQAMWRPIRVDSETPERLRSVLDALEPSDDPGVAEVRRILNELER